MGAARRALPSCSTRAEAAWAGCGSSKARPITTSGMTSGALTMPAKTVRPRKRVYFTKVNAASVPSTTAPQAVRKAIFRLSHSAASRSSSCSRASYQRSEKPRHTLGTGESLKE